MFGGSILRPLAKTRVGRRIARSAYSPPPHRRWRSVLDSESTWLRQILANIYEAKLVIFKIQAQTSDYPLSISPPGLAHSAGPAQNRWRTSGWRSFFRFFSLPKNALKFASKKWQKKYENRGFRPPKTVPKPSPKPFQMEAPKNTWFLSAFSTTSFKTPSLETLKISISPRREHDF